MISNLSHFVGERSDSEILYDTPFGYMFEYLCGCEHHLLAKGPDTIHYLQELGKIMADNGTPQDRQPEHDSTIPSIYTYLGQFIDHDITARTDRETNFSSIEDVKTVYPKKPEDVMNNIRNGRRPQLDLDSLFGEGPSFNSLYTAEADDLYHNTSLKLFINDSEQDYVDLRRYKVEDNTGENKKVSYRARIADARNDENLIVSQLHAAFIRTFNKISDVLEPGNSNQETYCQARQLTRWAYQYIVINDYLKQVCLPSVVSNVLYNGPFFFNTSRPFMPLEFSVAGFRFGHAMIRPFYTLNDQTNKNIMELLGPSMGKLIKEPEGELKPENVIKWSNFTGINGSTPKNVARKISPFIAKGLFDLSPVDTPPPPSILASLSQRNLLRGYLLSIPSGQAIAQAMRIEPMKHKELVEGLNPDQQCVLYDSGFTARTPLWYYILQEGKVQAEGNSLGHVGSMLVAETLIGLVKGDFNSYLNNMDHDAVSADGIKLPGSNKPIKNITDLLEYAEVPV
ncbi:heme peroxidase family protein [Salinimicrobium sp. TIG7-5_MAKvit]|uniref:peroxidase family protein n=1 Tax=Salinimicrobium sp. TIG7-5_MAKvit TaxID=3121289 RepID=UPI003C6E7B3E